MLIAISLLLLDELKRALYMTRDGRPSNPVAPVTDAESPQR
jgi:hypothetical protein